MGASLLALAKFIYYVHLCNISNWSMMRKLLLQLVLGLMIKCLDYSKFRRRGVVDDAKHIRDLKQRRRRRQ